DANDVVERHPQREEPRRFARQRVPMVYVWINRTLRRENASDAHGIQIGIGAILKSALSRDAKLDDVPHFGGEAVESSVPRRNYGGRRRLCGLDWRRTARESAQARVDADARCTNHVFVLLAAKRQHAPRGDRP